MRKLQAEVLRLLGRRTDPLNLVQQRFELVGLWIAEIRIRRRHTFGCGEPSSWAGSL